MKVYFTASITGREKYLDNYRKIVELLRKMDIIVYEETVEVTKEHVYEEISDEEKIRYYHQVLKWIGEVDLVVVEASYQSLSIGHEISLALERGKPVIVLYSEGQAPHFLVGVQSEKLLVEKYSLSDLDKVLKDSINYAVEQQDTRFNFFISPRHQHYLDWISRKRMVPRAVHLRKLLEADMAQNKEYLIELSGEKTNKNR